jgi:hypothetical protein
VSYNKLPLEQKLLTKAVQKGKCLIWIGQKDPKGYGRLRLNGKLQRAHRLMYELHNGPIEHGHVVLHSCDNPSCINPKHLSVGTQLENVHDMLAKGRANKMRGERHAKSKLTAEQVREIRRRYIPGKYGHGAHALAKEYGVSKPTIQAILNGESWTHIP